MLITRLKLKNWRNFRTVDIPLGYRAFVVGPNASGKSNLLDALRFLRDIAQSGGGLQRAVEVRGGISKIRCLAARQDPDVEIEVHLADEPGGATKWRYSLSIRQEVRGNRLPFVGHEKVWDGTQLILERPNDADRSDQPLLTQTHLEQIGSNQKFRFIAQFLETIEYLHLVPQLVRNPDAFSGKGVPGDPFGLHFLERLARTPEKTRQARLIKIEKALQIAVPQLKELTFVPDERGIPHLEAVYLHWRPHGGKQREDQFSDGTLRLLGLLWSLLDGDSLLLLEEPELSLHPGIVKALPALLHRLARPKKRQLILTTHSPDLLSDKSIGGEETILLNPTVEGTEAVQSSRIAEVKALLDAGLNIAEAVLQRARPANAEQLELFE